MNQSANDRRYKICIVTISLTSGGAERSTALLTRMLFSEGFDVHLVTLNDAIDYPFSGTLFNLGKYKSKKDTFFKRLTRLKKLKKYLKKEQFDYVIDNRNRQFAFKELFYLNYIYMGHNIIYVVRSFNLNQYFPKKKWIAQLMIQKSKGIVGVSKAIANTINTTYQTHKAIHIYNPMEVFSEQENNIEFSEKYILFLGRIEEPVKNLTLLLESYKNSDLIANKIYLKIVGDGPDKMWLEQKITSLNLNEFIQLIPFTPKVYPYLKNATFLALTSRYEGFPRVLVEALSAGTPVISVDCESGPNEIIKNEENGLLVENFNPKKLTEAFNRFIFDEDLYLHCKQNAKQSIAHLQLDTISKQWTKFFKNELH